MNRKKTRIINYNADVVMVCVFFLVPEGTSNIKKWISYEVNTLIFVWYHVEGIDPSWYPEPIDVIHQNKWWYRGRNEYYVNCHIQVMIIYIIFFKYGLLSNKISHVTLFTEMNKPYFYNRIVRCDYI